MDNDQNQPTSQTDELVPETSPDQEVVPEPQEIVIEETPDDLTQVQDTTQQAAQPQPQPEVQQPTKVQQESATPEQAYTEAVETPQEVVYDDGENLPLNMNDTQVDVATQETAEDQESDGPEIPKIDFSEAINNMDPNVAAALSYLITPVTGLLVFLITTKEKQFVKFHSFQSLLFGLVSLGAISISRSIPYVGGLVNSIVNIAVGFLWLFLMWKAFNKESYELPIIGKFAKEQVNS